MAIGAQQGVAQPSEPDSAEDGKALEEACREAADAALDVREVRIDPTAGGAFGYALVEGRSRTGGNASVICVYDRGAGTAAIGAPLVAASAPRRPERRVQLNVGAFADAGYRPCEGACEETLAVLSSEDAEQLRLLPEQVVRTTTYLRRGGMPGDSQSRLLFSLIDSGGLDMDFGSVSNGGYTCEVYLFGFLDQGVRRAGTHQCRISRENGVLRVRKTTGDRLDGRLMAWKGRIKAFVGRSFLTETEDAAYDPEHPVDPNNEKYGNRVGLALANDSTLYLVFVDQRGEQIADPTFFEVLKIGAR